jgi:hypothetical protein
MVSFSTLLIAPYYCLNAYSYPVNKFGLWKTAVVSAML